jgi:hypothetical protein
VSKTLAFGNVVLCEHATPSANKKFTLVNVYAGEEILVQHFPAQLMFGLFAELIPDANTPRRLELGVEYEGVERIHVVADMDPFIAGRAAVILLPSFPFAVESEGNLEMFVSAEGYDRQRIMLKRLTLSPALTIGS